MSQWSLQQAAVEVGTSVSSERTKDSVVRWGTLSCLYGNLTESQVATLETAISAYQRGYFEQAKSSISGDLPDYQHHPVIAVALSDLYEAQGLQHLRLQTLTEALAHIDDWIGGVGNEEYLLLLLRADARIQTTGSLRPTYKDILTDRDDFLGRGLSIEHITQIEARCLLEYRQVRALCKQNSNWAHTQSDEYFFIPALGAQDELPYLSRVFQQRNDLVTAVRLQQLYVRQVGQAQRKREIDRLDTLCQELRFQDNPAGLHYALLATNDMAVKAPTAEEADARFEDGERMLQSMNSQGFEDPRARLLLTISRYRRQTTDSAFTQATSFLAFANQASSMKSYTQEHQALLEAIIQLRLACEQDQDSTEQRRLLKEAQLRRLRMFDDLTPSAFWYGIAISDLGSNWTTRVLAREFLIYLDDFSHKYPSYDIPDIRTSLAGLGRLAAPNAGQSQRVAEFEEAIEKWQKCCSFAVPDATTFALSTDARSETLFYHSEIASGDPRTLLVNVVRVATRWAQNELRDGQVVNEDLLALLCCKYDPNGDRGAAFADASLASEHIFGSPQQPTLRPLWAASLSTFEIWLREQCTASHEEARHYLLKQIALSRTYTLRNKIILQSGHAKSSDDYVDLYHAHMDTVRVMRSICKGARAPNEDLTTLRLELEGISNLSLTLITGEKIVSDDLLRKHTDLLGEELCSRYAANGQLPELYIVLQERAALLYRRFMFFPGSVQPDAALPLFEQADSIYCELRRATAPWQLGRAMNAENFKAKLDRVQSLNHFYLIIGQALMAILAGIASAFRSQALESIPGRLQTLSLWIERAKSRTLLDELGVGARIPQRLLNVNEETRVAYNTAAEREIRLSLAINETNSAPRKMQLREELGFHFSDLRSNPLLTDIMKIREGECTNAQEIQYMVDNSSCQTAFVSYAQILGQSNDLWLLLFRTKKPLVIREVVGLKLENVRNWIAENLEKTESSSASEDFDVLGAADSEVRLHALDALVKPLEGWIEEGDLIVFCLWQELHRIPMHALTLGGDVLIERNPIAYCSGLSILQRCQQTVEDELTVSTRVTKAAIICALTASDKDPAAYGRLATFTGGEPISDIYISETQALTAMNDATFLHYHGHVVCSAPEEPLRQRLELDYYNKQGSTSYITAEQLFSVALHPGALAVLIGCQSGRAHINSVNDLLGLPAALLYAGATSIISTLWKIDIEDGKTFMEHFYREFEDLYHRSTAESATGMSKNQYSSQGTVNVAVALQKTLKTMRKSNPRPYHWAGFTLNGYWETISSFVHEMK